ncbi:nodulation protein NfeD [Halanaerobiaceae bacterium Z-7014]|uniref:Nodulation protein NfeD n=1 Tax=Halonatronomonas betaini TaxID=2778430 RepID=A0A931F5L7_9FIRM|nr:NfeD family protein [Halonatronomonas betaini]MBF8436015.1 nodulation protein NfeD [Halonatronomonas betaini]
MAGSKGLNKYFIGFIFGILFIFILAAPVSARVYFIPLHGDVDPGMATFLNRGLEEALENQAELVIVDVDTYGGLVDSGISIRDQLVNYPGEIVAYISNRAWSAGTLVALGADRIYMSEGSSMGAAETRPYDEKYISALRSEFAATAERRGRDPEIAAAMVDADIEIEDVIESGKLLSLTSSQAVELGFADGRFANFDEFLGYLGYSDADLTRIEKTGLESFAGLITNPFVSVFLLSLGIIALIGEALIPGFGVSGTIGVASLALFFSGYLIQGYAGMGLVVLFLAGLLLIAIEIFVIPGFGFTGITGIAAIFASLFFIFPDSSMAWTIMAAVLVLSTIGTIILIKFFGTSYFWRRISLGESLTTETGYVSSKDYKDLVGKTGRTVSTLRPAGIADFDGERIDVVSEGGYIEAETTVIVVKVEGRRVIVKPKKEE